MLNKNQVKHMASAVENTMKGILEIAKSNGYDTTINDLLATLLPNNSDSDIDSIYAASRFWTECGIGEKDE